MNSALIAPECVALGVRADDWREAIRIAGRLLTRGGFATPGYSDEMIHSVETLGPYIVIAPGIALAHSRPSPAVLATGLSLATLAEPVAFGSQDNDPVDIVIGLCATDHDGHLGRLVTVARYLAQPAHLELLRSTREVDVVVDSLVRFENEQESQQ